MRLLISFMFALLLCGQAQANTPLVGRANVVDGDTLEIRGARIRLWGVDAPESSQTCTDAGGQPWRCGRASANALSDYIGVKNATCVQRDTDRYQRSVSKCSVNGVDLGAWLVESGWAIAYTQYSKGEYLPMQQRAAQARAGMHRGQFVKPWDFRRQKRDGNNHANQRSYARPGQDRAEQ